MSVVIVVATEHHGWLKGESFEVASTLKEEEATHYGFWCPVTLLGAPIGTLV
jgi:hypothetical protein